MSENKAPVKEKSPVNDAEEDEDECPRKEKVIGSVSMQLNMTSMIDIIFQLLIYFIVTANFIKNEGSLKAILPGQSAAATEEEEGEKFYINMTSAGVDGLEVSMSFNNKAVPDFEGLYGVLAAASGSLVNLEKDSLIIKPDGAVRWQHVVNAFNQALRARYRRVSFSP